MEGPSLVPPTDGLLHASGIASMPPAHSISTQTSNCSRPPTVTESSEPPTNLPKMGAVCDGDQSLPAGDAFRTPSLGHSVADSINADSQLSCDTGTRPLLALDDKLEVGSAPDLLKAQTVHESVSKGSESYFPTATSEDCSGAPPADGQPCSAGSASILEADNGKEKVAALCHRAEDPTEQIPYAALGVERCARNFADTTLDGLSELHGSGQSADDQPVLSNDMNVDAVDSTTNHISPNPGTIAGQDVQESCFSLATALKELHKLLVTSGQGPSTPAAEGKPFPESNTANIYQGDNCPPVQEAESDDSSYEMCNENISVTDLEGSVFAEASLGTLNVSPGGVERSAEPSNGLGSTTIQEECPESSISPGEVPLSPPLPLARVHDLRPPGLSSDPAGLVGEQTSSARPPLAPFSSASDVERLVHAGFALPDALLALEQAEGNVELALLALLAKNIVVPT